MAEAAVLIAGRYRLVRLLGSGGMGVVWEARDERLDRPVALKLLRTQPQLTEAETEMVAQRAMREARITARLHHPHAVSVFDVVEHEGSPCLIMQLVPSVPLSVVMRDRGPLPVDEVARIGAEVASALAAAHLVGIVHRDVKPGNVLIGDDGAARISDFGISRALGDTTLTVTGMVTGTPAYLAPEVARGGDSTYASDVFSLGATLYAAVEGTPPFGSDGNALALLMKVATEAVAPPQRAGALGPVLVRALSLRPDDRPTMAEMASDLVATGDLPDPPGLDDSTPTTPLPPPVTDPEPTRRSTAVGRATATGAGMAASGRVAATGAAAGLAPVSEDAAPLVGAAAPPAPSRSAPPRSARAASAPAPRRRRGAVLGALLAALVAVALAVTLLPPLFAGDGRTAGVPADPSAPAGSTPAPSRDSSDETSAPPPSPSSPAARPTTPSPVATVSGDSDDEDADQDGPTASELAAAITSYYALMPDDTAAGWARLTSSYQRGTARNRDYYEEFWGDIDEVSVSDVRGLPPDRAEATVTYRFKSQNRVQRERTTFRLVDDDGTLKIDRSSVLGA